jgi:glycosyltransferase involved in cell wall biosynthesis
MYPDFSFHWLHIGDGEVLRKLQDEVKLEPGLSDRIELLGHLFSHDEVLAMYTNRPIDIFVNLSESEGTPVSALEAASFGVHILATEVGGNSDLVRKIGGTLLSVNPSPEEIARNLMNFSKTRNLVVQQKVRFMSSGHSPEDCYPIVTAGLVRLANGNTWKI